MAALLDLQFCNIKKQAFLIRVVCFFWILSKLASYKSWIADRSLPTVALFGFLDAIPLSVHLIIFSISMLLLSTIIFKPLKILLQLFIIVEIFSVLLDVLRIQPWEYLYLFIIGFYVVFEKRPLFFYKCLLAIVSSTYIFSGLHKFGGAFLHNIWDSFFLKTIFNYQNTPIPWGLHYAGVLLSMGEFFAGLLLLINRPKKPVVIALIIMHILIVITTGLIPSKIINSIIPWNVMMVILLLYILNLSRISEVENKIIRLPSFTLCIISICWYVLPFSSLFGFWALPLSSGMYTGKTPAIYICWKSSDINFPDVAYLTKDVFSICNGNRLLLLDNWTSLESTQAAFPALWYYKKLNKKLKDKYPDADIKMFCTYYPFTEIREIR